MCIEWIKITFIFLKVLCPKIGVADFLLFCHRYLLNNNNIIWEKFNFRNNTLTTYGKLHYTLIVILLFFLSLP